MRWTLITALILISAAVALWILRSADTEGQAGVGLSNGSMRVEQDLHTGGSYQLPPLVVVNTGQIAADYSVRIVHRAGQQELRPLKDWFTFDPPRFFLKPKLEQSVSVEIRLPVGAEPGEYFALIEAYPVARSGGGPSIQIAAATKLNFKVVSDR